MNVALVVMPFGAADRPSLAAGLLQAALKGRGIRCDTKYLNLALARTTGSVRYKRLVESFNTSALAGEWIFSQLYYGSAFSRWETYAEEILGDPEWGLREEWRPIVRDLLDAA